MGDKAKAVIYTRFSPRPNADDSESCERQEAICKEYCVKKEYEVVWYFEDRKASGDEADRPGLWQAIKALKRDYVLVVRWRNRLAREVFLSEFIRRSVEKIGARIEAVEGSNNGSGPDEVFIQQILAAFAEREKKIIAIRTKYAMLRHQGEGRIMGSKLPYGYARDMDRLGYMKQCDEEQEIIGTIRGLAKGGKGLREIAAMLDLMGYCPRTARTWNHKTVMKILRRKMEI